MKKAKKSMKKKKDWQTKAKKRKYREQDRGILGVVFIVKHFWKNLTEWIEKMEDPRNQSYITYTQSDYVYMGILKNVCGVKTMHSMEEQFNHVNCIRTLGLLSGNNELHEMPHSDSLNNYLRMLSPECLAELRKKMIKSLLRMKSFYSGRLLGKYWRIILDGTGLYCFKEKHCDNCLVMTHTDENGKKSSFYYHKVLEAKLVLSGKLVLSIDTEFVENENEQADKQDCETNAAKRLLNRLKKDYPRLPVCIQADNLYETQPMMELCRKNGYKYIFTHKRARQKCLDESYELFKEGGESTEVKGVCRERGNARFVNHVESTLEKPEEANIFEYSYEAKTGKSVKFQWLTNIEVTEKMVEELVSAARGRWKIENEGFNNQKNGIYDIEHLNSRDSNAMKNHYLLTQISDIIMQIYLAWNPIFREIKQSVKNASSTLLESFRRLKVTEEDALTCLRYTTVYLE